MQDSKYWIAQWNDKHCYWIHRVTPDERNEKMADYAEQLLLDAKSAYYNTGEPIMSDQDYDKYEGYLRILRPDSKILDKVGADIK